ncbi:MAG: hypothetical protein LRY71_17975 [Bacillaceae bacterium]|nr:hypothetical protein [Bacillaceae bacterium]
MNWLLFLVGFYLSYYTIVYAKIVWEDEKRGASTVILLLAVVLAVLPFVVYRLS